MLLPYTVLLLYSLLPLAVKSAPDIDPDMLEMIKMLRNNCVDETGVDRNILETIDNGGDLFPDPKLKCYIKCVMETAGMFSEGEVQVETLLSMLPPEIVGENAAVFEKCDTQKGSDDCDTAFLTQVCWQKANKKDYFLV